MSLKIDLHVHTCYSYDAVTTPKEVITYSKKRGLDGVAITDHDTLHGALKLLQKNEILVIPGIEITAMDGHVIALNITKTIPPKLDLSETVQRIHEAGGIAVAAHPTSIYKSTFNQRVTSCDAIEVINSAAVPFSFSTYLSQKLATRLKLPQTGGSDAHYAPEIGAAYTIVEADPDIDEIIQTIKRGATLPLGKPIPWRVRLRRGALSLKRRI
ncbi:MAG: CehA/McbA family metallohydrolase [Candidatus Bathyarchaeaceae archaeon]